MLKVEYNWGNCITVTALAAYRNPWHGEVPSESRNQISALWVSLLLLVSGIKPLHCAISPHAASFCDSWMCMAAGALWRCWAGSGNTCMLKVPEQSCTITGEKHSGVRLWGKLWIHEINISQNWHTDVSIVWSHGCWFQRQWVMFLRLHCACLVAFANIVWPFWHAGYWCMLISAMYA